MKNILCYGDSLTWGYNPHDGTRYPFEQRWPGVLQHELGNKVRVIEEALNGRTTVSDSWLLPYRNGKDLLPPILESHAPLDVVILLLGTNDTAPSLSRTAEEIALGCVSLAWIVQKSQAGPKLAAPKVLIVAPPPISELSPMMDLIFRGAEGTSKRLAKTYAAVAQANGCAFLDAGKFVRTTVDGIHLEPPALKTLGQEIKKAVEPLLK